MLALEIEFEKGLYLHDEGYDTVVNSDLLQPLKKSTHIYTVPLVAETSFDPMSYQISIIPTFLSTPKGRPVEPWLHWVVSRLLKFNDLPLPAVDSNNNIEEDFPTAPLDDSVWSEEPKPEICAFTWLWENQRLVTLSKYPPPLQEHSRILVSVLLRKFVDILNSHVAFGVEWIRR